MKGLPYFLVILAVVPLFINGSPVPQREAYSKLHVAKFQPERTKEYIQMFFMPVKKVLNPNLNLRYTMQSPPLRSDYPQGVLSQAIPVDFDKMNEQIVNNSQSIFDKEKKIIKRSDFLIPSTDLIRITMEEVFSKPRNPLVDKAARESVGSYIYEKMGRSGLIITIQDFKHMMPLKAYSDFIGLPIQSSPVVSGSNIIGFLPGRFSNTKKDRPLIIGAHWDTVANTTGFNDNGSGVAVMLEVARILAQAKCFKPDYSLYFVAFDSEEEGSFGSQEFLNQIIVPHFIRQGVRIQGAIVLDTLLNFNEEPGSQSAPDDWATVVPETKRNIEANENKGDFLAIVGRNHPIERKMSDLIRKWATLDGLKTQEFNLKKLPPYHEPSLELLQEHSYFWQSDNSRFWFYKEDEDFMSFPAILLTDTAYHRGYMKDCYHDQCDNWNQDVATEKNYKFLTSSAQSLVLSVAEMAMEGHESSCIKQTVQQIIKTASKPSHHETLMKPIVTRPKITTTARPPLTTTMIPASSVATSKIHYPKKEDIVNEVEQVHPDDLDLLDLQTLLKEELRPLLMQPKEINQPNDKHHSIGTQININNLNINLQRKVDDNQQCLQNPLKAAEDDTNQGLVLGSGDVDYEVLANVLKNFFGEVDRRKYKGKHRNSPMVIKFLEQ